jgi:hypothetical protein
MIFILKLNMKNTKMGFIMEVFSSILAILMIILISNMNLLKHYYMEIGCQIKN